MRHQIESTQIMVLLTLVLSACSLPGIQPASTPTLAPATVTPYPSPTLAATITSTPVVPTSSPTLSIASPSATLASVRPTSVRSPTPRVSAPPVLDLIASVGGKWSSALALAGNYAYVTVGPSFVILDVSHAENPRVAGSSSLLPQPILDIALSSGYAYVAGGSAGIYVFNISRPGPPVLVGSLPIHARQIVLAGDYGYTVDGEENGGLCVWHVDDPVHWSLQSSGGTGGYNQVTVEGRYAYAIADGLDIFDIGDPHHLSRVGSYAALTSATDMTVVGPNLLVTEMDLSRGHAARGSLHIVDVSQPAHPVEVNLYPTSTPAYGVSAEGDFVYLATAAQLMVLNISDPRHIADVSTYSASGTMTDIMAVGDRLYLASASGDSLHIVDIARPERPLYLGSYITPKSAQQVALAGRYAFVADSARGLIVIDVSDPLAPLPVSASEPCYAWGVALQGDYAYLAAYDLRILNISDPLHPVQVGAVPIPQLAERVAVSGPHAYVAAGKNFVIVDITNPAGPRVVSELTSPDAYSLDLALAGAYALIASGSKLRVVDIADSLHPREVAAVPMSGWAYSVRVLGNYAYLAARDSLAVVDITSPANPRPAALYPTQNALYLAAQADRIYIGEGGMGLRVLNVSEPTRPVALTTHPVMEGAGRITAANGYVYVSEMNGGLAILRWRAD